ncbi:MAG: hypothetical protein JKX75_03905 [Gammaproteobacteria bacterium]|nr:hypothetical protein [Gammaproteobacteria bacterium]
MAQGHFLVRNRHQNTWYGRVVVPLALRPLFNHRRELRHSLHTPDKQRAKRLSRLFWVQCQSGFEQLQQQQRRGQPFQDTQEFISWLSQDKGQGHNGMAYKVDFVDMLGRRHVIDLDDPEKEEEFARRLQDDAAKLLGEFKDRPDILDRLMNIGKAEFSSPANQPESPTTFHEAVDLYYNKLETQGRKGRKLAFRTLLHYRDKLKFWQKHFGQRQMHTLTLKEIGEIQNWLPCLGANFTKKNYSVEEAVMLARGKSTRLLYISDKSRAEYLGQLRGLLEFSYANGFIASEMARHIEIPNTKLSKAIDRLPFTTNDLQMIFPGSDYGIDFGIHKSGVDRAAKFWFPLLAVFSGARLEELGQLNATDIKTCPETGIVYAAFENEGFAADGHKKHTKNLNSVRPVPIHSTLVEIGFLNYVKERQADTKNGLLFKLTRDKQGRLAKRVANWFARVEQRKTGNPTLGYIERRGVESKGQNRSRERWSKSFHSFRHTVIDNLRGKKLANGEYIREPDIGLVMGHDRAKLETAAYGVDRSQLELRKAVIEAIEYPDVGFGEIGWQVLKKK